MSLLPHTDLIEILIRIRYRQINVQLYILGYLVSQVSTLISIVHASLGIYTVFLIYFVIVIMSVGWKSLIAHCRPGNPDPCAPRIN